MELMPRWTSRSGQPPLVATEQVMLLAAVPAMPSTFHPDLLLPVETGAKMALEEVGGQALLDLLVVAAQEVRDSMCKKQTASAQGSPSWSTHCLRRAMRRRQ
mmetsp:Transcript_64222/g.153146  ORF Transcript_64222/g.153146 Transcript_64222/m.153146 type:complete len:102 (-) Transcript_64222:1486-1791(-)